ncbi:thioredoxin-like protein [Dendrothele bispora CBS 962.96]|uniref:Thioredoxin-like protein n=1 Tax=Dendrothele bispora (strain CBS 962.96) TaxID=1314807 RepID=A0A4S8M1M4_DENBC|nr:thioredoxin-like protein [Dendrothele bispora CBS 962.96]
MSPPPSTSIRRRRFLLLTVLAFLVILFFFHSSDSSSWRLPAILRDSSSNLSRANIVSLVKFKQQGPNNNQLSSKKVDEIYGLIHLVTGGDEEHQHVLVNKGDFDPTEPVGMEVYAPGEVMDWEEEMERLNDVFPVVVFSKSFCPFSARAKRLLEEYELVPQPMVIEVDLRDDATQIKALLTRLTSQSTFPNIIVQGKSIGGSDDLKRLHESGALKKLLEKAGVEVEGDV